MISMPGVTPAALTRVAGVAAVAAGALFIGVQIGHPHLDAMSVTTTEVIVRNSLKVLMAALALAGITGMYVSQVRRNGLLGLVGYLVLGAGYLTVLATSVAAATVLPSVAGADPRYVDDVLTVSTGGTATGDIGLLATVFQAQGALYLVGGLVFGVALFRAGVLNRWAAGLLAVGGVVSVVLSLLPDALYRLLAFPNGIALIGLGVSLWLTARHADAVLPARGPRVTAAGAE